jgi:hypothetical protein
MVSMCGHPYTTSIARHTSISNSKRQGTNVISNHSVRSINVINIISTNEASVLTSGLGAYSLDGGEQLLEQINVVVGSLVLQDRSHSLKTSTCNGRWWVVGGISLVSIDRW